MNNLQAIEKQDYNKLATSEIPNMFAEMYQNFGLNATYESAFVSQMIESEKAGKIKGIIATPEGKRSLAIALFHAASNGLSANPMQRDYSLVPYSTKVVLQREYRGELRIMRRDFGVEDAIFDVVIDKEEFSEIYKNDAIEKFSHKKKSFRHVTEANLIGGYYMVKLSDGRTICDTISKEHILAARESAPAKVIWNKWFEKMAVKTVIHQCFDAVAKKIDLSPENSIRLMNLVRHETEDVPESDVQVLENEPETVEVEVQEQEELSLVEFAETLGIDVLSFAEFATNQELLLEIIGKFTDRKTFNNFTSNYKTEIIEFDAVKQAANAKYLELNPSKKQK